MNIKMIICCLFVWATTISVYAAEYTCTHECTQSDFQALENAASTGDTIHIASGTHAWTGSAVIDVDGLIVKGAGNASTTIDRGTYGSIFVVDADNVEFSDFTSAEGRIHIYGQTGFKIHDVDFTSTAGGNGVLISHGDATHAEGVVWDCNFTNMRVLVYGSLSFDHASDLWEVTLGLGTQSRYVFIEDCTFQWNLYGSAVDGNDGGGYVFRFNAVMDAPIDAHSLQGGNHRAHRKWEIYHNTINAEQSSPSYNYVGRLRGGTGMVFNNTIDNDYFVVNGFDLTNVRSEGASSPLDQCDGYDDIDGNTLPVGTYAGYPCLDQIGRSTDQSQYADNTNYPGQDSKPAYAWGNTYGGSLSNFAVTGTHAQTYHIIEDRDFYNGKASFDGTSGVGVGVRLSRPSTCTTGVGYWSTDQGEWNSDQAGNDGCLDVCQSTNSWTDCYYTPYTYPHPLRSGSDVSASSSGSSGCFMGSIRGKRAN